MNPNKHSSSLEAEIELLAAKLKDLESSAKELLMAEDPTKGVYYAEEIFNLKQDILRLKVDLEIKQKKRHRLVLEIDSIEEYAEAKTTPKGIKMNLVQKIIASHLVFGNITTGTEIGLRIDQTLTQDATGTMTFLQFEAIGLPKVKTELSVSYVDHNTMQMDFRNPDDHRYLRTAAAKYGVIFSPPGTGICHQLHLENFARPGRTLIGADSHTPTAGGIGSLAMGAGGLSVALAMAGEPYVITMPKVVGVKLVGQLQGWAAAKDIILHLLGLLSVKGGVGKAFEYFGPGVADLDVPERATITNMGAELGATASVFPSDEVTRQFLISQGRERDFVELGTDPDAAYDEEIVIDLSTLVPLAATPHMPDLVKPAAELAGIKVDQVAIGSCTNSSYADLKAVAEIMKGKKAYPGTEILISPGSKQVLKLLAQENLIETFLDFGARLLECTCGPCIGMGGAPVSGGVSVRTFNRNFEGRSGTQDAKVYLVSPQTAAMCALKGHFCDPEEWGEPPARKAAVKSIPSIRSLFVLPPEDSQAVRIQRGPNIVPLKSFAPLPEELSIKVALKVGDNITTDHILPGGAKVMALRSNIPAISEYLFSNVDPEFFKRVGEIEQAGIIAGENYGQGSSREHAALAPRHMGVRVVIAKSIARIHRANLVNFGILPLYFANGKDYDLLNEGDQINIITTKLTPGGTIAAATSQGPIELRNDLTDKELKIIRAGGMLASVSQNG